MKRTLVQLGLVAAIISTLAGCGGGGGSDGAPGATGATGATGAAATATGVTVPAGTALVSTSTAVAFASNATPASSESLTAWKALQPTATLTSISIASPPVVKFTVKDQDGKAVIGLGSKSLNSTSTTASSVAALTNLAFTLAKLVPGTNGAPSKWVSYNVVRPPTNGEKAGTVPSTASCNADKTWCGTFPAVDSQGTLVDNGDGSYQYTFYRDPKQAATIVASLTDSVDGLAKKADLGDVSFDATLTHRLGIQIGGAAPGSGSNVPGAVALSVTSVAMVNTGNLTFDFRPDGGAVTTTRDIVQIESCASCHDGKVFAHGSRKDPKYCVTCHTDQIRYTFSQEATPAGAMVLTGTTRPTTAVVDGRALGNFPNMVHHIHMGDELIKTGYNFNASAEGLFNSFGLPMDRRNCTKCHSGATQTNSLQAVKTTNGDNWKTVPSRLACGGCHDGINFATGLGTTASGATTGHGTGGVGGAQADDSRCVTCHDAAAIALVHRTNVPTANNPTVAAGVATFSYEIKTVTVDSSKRPVVTFRVLKDGVAQTLAIPTLVTNAQTGVKVVSPAYEPIPGFAGGPNFLVAFSVPQDGIAAPADFNVSNLSNSAVSSLANALIPAGAPKAGITTGPDASGYYTTILTGDTLGQPADASCPAVTTGTVATCIAVSTASTVTNKGPVLAAPYVLPSNASMVTVAIQGGFTQKSGFAVGTVAGATQAAYVAANLSTNPAVNASGGLAIKPMLVKATATGYVPRRTIVAVEKCNSCHDQLGAVTVNAFHGGTRNDPTFCNFCHNGNRLNTGWSGATSTYIHAVHGKSKRTNTFSWHAVGTAGATFAQNTYTTLYTFITPGVLQDCAQCHVANTVNYGLDAAATASASAKGANLVPSLLWSTTATGTVPTTLTAAWSPYVTPGVNYGNGYTYNPVGQTVAAYTSGTGTTTAGTITAAHVAGAGGEIVPASPYSLVNSPISSACFSCHDTTTAKGHMEGYGGFIYRARNYPGVAAAMASNTETCLVCHGAGKVADAAIIHHK